MILFLIVSPEFLAEIIQLKCITNAGQSELTYRGQWLRYPTKQMSLH